MITQEQAERAVELLKEIENNIDYLPDIHNDWWNSRDRLFDEIKANEPTTTATQAQNWTAIKAKTNGDFWRLMTDEEIAEFLYKYEFARQGHWTKNDIFKWLKQEAKQ